jgi:hypothetical protein
MRAGGRPKNLKSGARWVSSSRGGRKRKAKEEKPKQETNPNIAYDSDGDGQADLIGWILHAPVPECPTWVARGLVILLLSYTCLKYS